MQRPTTARHQSPSPAPGRHCYRLACCTTDVSTKTMRNGDMICAAYCSGLSGLMEQTSRAEKSRHCRRRRRFKIGSSETGWASYLSSLNSPTDAGTTPNPCPASRTSYGRWSSTSFTALQGSKHGFHRAIHRTVSCRRRLPGPRRAQARHQAGRSARMGFACRAGNNRVCSIPNTTKSSSVPTSRNA